LWEAESPPGERLQEYVQKEWNGEPHEGETPPRVIAEVLADSQSAVTAIDAAAPWVTTNRAEFDRLRNDIRCIRAMSAYYAAKAQAAMFVLRYGYSHDVRDMETAETFLAQSFSDYQKLSALASPAYHFANGMQTSYRKIPIRGAVHGVPANYLWSQLVPLYQKELEDFQTKIAKLKQDAALKPAAGGPAQKAGSSASPAVPIYSGL
ncbi:MAG: alpha-d-galacturonidase, partial [Limisphaerales bacterium]